MKKYLYLMIIILSVSCEFEEDKSAIQGYYFNPQNSLIYHFNKEKMETYNIIDSIHNLFNINIKKKFIEIDQHKFNYKSYRNDSIVIYDYTENKENTCLIKFDFKEFDIDKLNNTDWLLNYNDDTSKRLLKQYFKIMEPRQGIYFFESNDSLKKESLPPNYIPFRAKYFDKFNAYLFTSIVVIGNYKENKLEVLNIDYFNDNKTKKFKLIKQKPELNHLILGEWSLIKEGKSNDRAYLDLSLNLENNKLSFEDKFNKVKEIFNFNKIAFTDEQVFIRFFENKKKSIRCNLYPSSISSYLFSDNIYFQYFEINLLTKDSLRIEIPNHNLSYDFVRSRDSSATARISR